MVKFAQETTGLEVRKDYQFRPPLRSSLTKGSDSCDLSITSYGSATSGATQRSALKTPKYKACPQKMKEQSNLEVTTMSMDLDISDDESDDEEPQQRSPPSPKQTKRTPPPPPRRQSRHKEEKKAHPRIVGKSPSRARRISTSSTPTEHAQVRPDPEEHQHNGFVCHKTEECSERRSSHDSDTGPYIMTRDVSDDVSAISFMGSVISGQGNYVNSLVPFQEDLMEPVLETPDFDFDNDEEDNVSSSTNNYDKKGRCVKHPHVRLRKKKILGRGWKVLMSACPDCCVDELRRIKMEAANKKAAEAKNPAPQPVKTALRSSLLKDNSDDTASLSTSSHGSDEMNQVDVVQKENEGIFVKNMKWTDVKGRRGSYTGQVDDKFIPNGQGSMQYEDGKVKEGEWRDGGCKSTSGRSRGMASERSSRSRSVSVRPGPRSRSTSVTPHTRSRSSSRARS
jgi:predicted  nucleic acid-binding Zn-ribbon protein